MGWRSFTILIPRIHWKISHLRRPRGLVGFKSFITQDKYLDQAKMYKFTVLWQRNMREVDPKL